LAPRYLGIRAKIAKSFARIHKANLINFGILPLTFKNPADYDAIRQGDRVIFKGVRTLIASGASEIAVQVEGREIVTLLEISERDRQDLLAGGTLNYVKRQIHGK
jgi:aconitate hydratase